MKHKNFIIFFTIAVLVFSACARQGRSAKRELPKPLAAILSETAESVKKQ
ncbi:penicillin-binding protein activator LpoB, partial [Leptospira ellisii]